jgi:hypothetical protein
LRALCLIAVAYLGGCASDGTESDRTEAGYEALRDGEYKNALAHFDAARERAELLPPEYVELSVARCQALAHISASSAVSELISLGTYATEKDYSFVLCDLRDKDERSLELIDAGLSLYPDSSALEALREVTLDRMAQNAEARANMTKFRCIAYI